MKLVLLSAVMALFAAGIVYGLVTLDYEENIQQANSDIDTKSTELIELWSAPPTSPPATTPTAPPVEEDVDSVFCLKCHDKKQTSSFHYPEKIKALDEKIGKPIMICTTCHGSPVMPVHFKAIQEKRVKCETCHIRDGGGFSVPVKREGDLLICQLCHANGNYITIHVDGRVLDNAEIDAVWIWNREGLECTICHNKNLYDGKSVLDLHEEKSDAGDIVASPFETRAPRFIEEPPVWPSIAKPPSTVIEIG